MGGDGGQNETQVGVIQKNIKFLKHLNFIFGDIFLLILCQFR